MSDSDAEGGTDTAGTADAAFAAVADPTRVAILRALATAVRETGEPACRFSDLRKRAGVEDSGRFRYHLNRLRGHFVEQTAAGYQLTHAGGEMVAAILAGRYVDHGGTGPTELDSECSVCEAGVVGRYESGRIEVECEGGHPLLSWPLPPNAATDATVADLARLATSLVVHAVDLALQGVCSRCYGPVEVRVEPAGAAGEEAEGETETVRETETERQTRTERAVDTGTETERAMPGFRAQCETCSGSVVGPAWFALLVHPDVEAFYHAHGLPLRETYLWELAHVTVDPDASGPDDRRLAVSLGDEVLSATLSPTGSVLDTQAVSAGE
jgi:DNA-binding transcriptional ArsR family regulator